MTLPKRRQVDTETPLEERIQKALKHYQPVWTIARTTVGLLYGRTVMTQSARPVASEQSVRPINLDGLRQGGRTVRLLVGASQK